MRLSFATQTDTTIPVHVLEPTGLDRFLGTRADTVANWVRANGFTGAAGQALSIPDANGQIVMALAGVGTAADRARQRFALAAAAMRLPDGTYSIASAPEDVDLTLECLGWLLSGYRFSRYKPAKGAGAGLTAPDGVDANQVEVMANAECLTRDLINTPASDMGPEAMEQAVSALAQTHGASMAAIRGNDLLDQNFPMIHAVGRAAAQEPRLLDLRWGDAGPALTLVGKGVCFDTGGLNLKPGASMGLMKKDMGGAANVLGLADMIMGLKLPLRLRVLIPAVENSVSASAMRPGDVLMSRQGLSVEINNTDAEGRLVLADALTLAAEDAPDLMISMATLTGAARVAVGPDLAPYFTDDEQVSTALSGAASAMADPVWRLPFHAPYEANIEPAIADLDNAPAGGMAGAITAALFLRRFSGECRYVHFDIFGWTATPSPARPKGGAGQGPRAILGALPGMLDL